MTFKDQGYFPGLSRNWNFQEKIQCFLGGMGTYETTRKLISTEV